MNPGPTPAGTHAIGLREVGVHLGEMSPDYIEQHVLELL